MAQVGLTQAVGALWDSRGQLSLSGKARTGVFPRVRLKLRDSRRDPTDTTQDAGANDLKFLKRLRRGLVNSFGKAKDQALLLSPVGCQCKMPAFAHSWSG